MEEGSNDRCACLLLCPVLDIKVVTYGWDFFYVPWASKQMF